MKDIQHLEECMYMMATARAATTETGSDPCYFVNFSHLFPFFDELEELFYHCSLEEDME